MAPRRPTLKFKDDTTMDRLKTMELALGKLEESLVDEAIKLLWSKNLEQIKTYFSRLESGTALFDGKTAFNKSDEIGENVHFIEEDVL